MNLANEYRKRHNMSCVVGIDEGVLFLNKNKKPAIIVITSGHSRCRKTCNYCEQHSSGIIVETIPSDDTRYRSLHHHMNSDEDIHKFIEDKVGSFDIFYPKQEQEIEYWLLDFYLQSGFIPTSIKRNILKFDSPMTKMLNMIESHPKIFESFYVNMYLPFLAGRKYLLLG